MALMLASLPYWLQYVLGIDDPFAETIILLGFLLASVASSPIWVRVARKYGNRVGYMCGTGGTAINLIITLFISMFIPGFFAVMIGIALIGFTMGATWTLIYATFSDVIDEIIVETKERDEGIFYGFRTFFGRLSIVILALTFGIIHPLTNFNPKSLTQPIQAQWGISFGMFVVPAIFYFIGFLFMWKIYDLKPPKVDKIKKELVKLDI
jgi:Na+/melibiose symporter-like transporter